MGTCYEPCSAVIKIVRRKDAWVSFVIHFLKTLVLQGISTLELVSSPEMNAESGSRSPVGEFLSNTGDLWVTGVHQGSSVQLEMW